MKNDIKSDFQNIKKDFKSHKIKKQLPNLLTASRLLSPFILIPLIYYDKLLIAIIMVALFSLTDALDGYFARKYNAISLFGKYLDACVDKVFALSLLIPIILKITFDKEIYGLVIVSIIFEIIIGSLNIYAFFKNLQPESTKIGKIKTIFLFTLLGILYLNKIIFIKPVYIFLFIFVTISFQIATIVSYFNQIKKRKLEFSSN